MASTLIDVPISIRLKLALLWASLMSCYIYGDYFGLYVPGKLKGMLAGDGPIGPSSQGSLVATAILLAVPALMIALSALVPARACRWANVILGCFYAAVMAVTMPGSWRFYQVLGCIEIALSVTTIAVAMRWPRGPRSTE